ncbi:14699_t:CDS:2 [Gigaspora rosea]|nr:14699_t:CDS:2 [Gigaspora rosea]
MFDDEMSMEDTRLNNDSYLVNKKARVEYISMISDVINSDQSGVGDEKIVESGGSSSDCKETNGVVNDIKDPAWL